MLEGLTILIFLQFTGELIAGLARLPIPGPVIGLALLAGFALWRGRMPEPVVIAGDAILRHLSLLFVPAGVGLIAFGDRLAREGLLIVIVLVLSTAITMTVTALVFRALTRDDEGNAA
ncbi:MAG: CidA/LrgA family protein [Beijerinckiaceae bacterium]|jgi:holin-like protein|nr:CidA/LrgA family protein [Beijerinckiaceae bacterium]